jgi:hypothetical protein
MFRGNTMWHLRARAANTVMLYFKLNAFNSDPLGEDPRTAEHRSRTRRLLAGPDAYLADTIPLLSRRVDYVHRRWNHQWTETLGVVLYGEKHFTIDEEELRALRAMDGRRTVREVIAAVGGGASLVGKLRRLAERGVVDLIEGT